MKDFSDRGRHIFLHVLAFTDYVHGVRDGYGQVIGAPVGSANCFLAGLRRRIRVRRTVRFSFQVVVSEGSWSVHLVRRDVQKLLDRTGADVFQEGEDKLNVVFDKVARLFNRTINM